MINNMNSYKLQLITLNKTVPSMTLLSKLVVILTHYTSLLNLLFTKWENNSPSASIPSLRNSMDSTENAFEYYSVLQFTLKVLKLASIILCCLLYLQHNFWLIMEGFVITEISLPRCTINRSSHICHTYYGKFWQVKN